MRVTSRPDLQISGIGNASGGDYHHVQMEGVCKVAGSIDCFAFTSSGMSTVDGSIRAAERFQSSGKLTIHGGLQAGAIELEGQTTIEGPLQAEHFQVNGYVRINGHSQSKHCNVRGALIVDGWLTGEQIEVKLEGPLQAEGIKAQCISVKHSRKGSLRRLMESLIPVWHVQTYARIIEADIVDIEETTAEVVRGRTVMIGPGCNIDLVEYESELVVHPQAQVGVRHHKQV